MSERFDVSVIVCTKNRPDLLLRCLLHLCHQKMVNFEAIIVNDGGTLPAEHPVHDFLNRENFRLITMCASIGVAGATNAGVSEASGRFIALVGDDDFFDNPEKLKLQLEQHLLFEKPDEVLSGTWWRRLDGCDKMVGMYPTADRKLTESMILKSGVGLCGSTAFFSKKLWKEVGGMDVQMARGTDSDLFRRMLLRGAELVMIPIFTTVVDVSHQLERITPMETRTRIKGGLKVHIYTIRKYFRLFLKNPAALTYRIWLIMLLLYKYVRAQR